MITEKELIKVTIIQGFIHKHGVSELHDLGMEWLEKEVDRLAAIFCPNLKPEVDDRDNTVAPGRIMISDERLRQLKIGYTFDMDEAIGPALLNKTHIRFKHFVNQKRAARIKGRPLTIDAEIETLVKVGALIAANIDQLLRIKKVLQK